MRAPATILIVIAIGLTNPAYPAILTSDTDQTIGSNFVEVPASNSNTNADQTSDGKKHSISEPNINASLRHGHQSTIITPENQPQIEALKSSPPKNPSPTKTREIWQEPITGMNLVKVTGGCFEMGQNLTEQRYLKRDSAEGNFEKYYADELPQHKVCVDEFWMGIHEVTQSEWQKVMGFNPSVFQDGDDYPVEMVSWDDAQLFLRKLNELNNTFEFRLPSEAEWEYAARAGTSTIYTTGDAIKSTDANFNGSFPFGLNLIDEYRKTSLPVGSFKANAFGLYDMHGNVWEWCNDWYQANYYQHEVVQNPAGPDTGQMKVLRGGSWFRYSAHIRSATRYKNKQSGQYADTGFRVVKSTRSLTSDSGKAVLFDKDF